MPYIQSVTQMQTVFESIAGFCAKHPKLTCYVFVDIDNTFLKMKDSLGSDQWFKWQLDMIEQKKDKEHGCVTKDLTTLCDVLHSLYKTQPCESCETHVPSTLAALVKKYNKQLKLVFITARAHCMRNTSIDQIELLFGYPIPPYEIITCNGDSKADYIYKHVKNTITHALFMVDDSLEHLAGVSNIPELARFHIELFHYINQLHAVIEFHENDKQPYIDMFNLIP